MAMKQTQTKLFDFADVGLDFCSGSKNLFPDRFKKMLALGYNQQTVASVSLSGNQVTLNYGVTHGYTADRVLKVNSGALAAINGGEFWIDAVTATSVTLTIDSAPTSILGGFTTKIASLGYSLVYEQGNVHVYKFKALDESDLFLRLCFQNQLGRRNCISPCIGKSFDLATGFITDTLSLSETRQVTTPHNGFKWEFGYPTGATFDNYTYAQGYSQFGKGIIIGSLYHFLSLHNALNTNGIGRICGFLPASTLNYNQINYPMLVGESYSVTSDLYSYQLNQAQAYLGNIRVILHNISNNNQLITFPYAPQSFLPSSIDSFNTTTASNIQIYEYTTRQILGVAYGMYICNYDSVNYPPATHSTSPSFTYDIDLTSLTFMHYMSAGYVGTGSTHFAVPIEEIKIA